MLHRVTNSHHLRRVWPHLVNADTGTTLELDPGESADVDVPDGFADAHLSLAAAKNAAKRDSKRKITRKAAPDNAAAETPEPVEPVTQDPQTPAAPADTEE